MCLLLFLPCLAICLDLFLFTIQWRSQNAEKVTHIKGSLHGQAVILFNRSLFKMGTSLKRKNILQEGVNSFLQEQSLVVWKSLYLIRWPPLNGTDFITHVRNCVMGATPMTSI